MVWIDQCIEPALEEITGILRHVTPSKLTEIVSKLYDSCEF